MTRDTRATAPPPGGAFLCPRRASLGERPLRRRDLLPYPHRQAATRDWGKIAAALPDQTDRDALARRVAEMRQLAKFTELATLPHIDTSINDKNARTVKLLHTEARVVVATKPQKGKAYDYSMRPSESYS